MKTTCCTSNCRQGRDCPKSAEASAQSLWLFALIAIRLALCAVPFIIWKMES